MTQGEAHYGSVLLRAQDGADLARAIRALLAAGTEEPGLPSGTELSASGRVIPDKDNDVLAHTVASYLAAADAGLVTALKQAEALRKALEKYGDHLPSCAMQGPEDLAREYGCTCGLAAALRESAKEEE